jgi:hypothetical protein
MCFTRSFKSCKSVNVASARNFTILVAYFWLTPLILINFAIGSRLMFTVVKAKKNLVFSFSEQQITYT